LAVLEEIIGVREPRAACAEAYKLALRNVATYITQNSQQLESVADVMLTRVNEVEKSIGMVLRMEEGVGSKLRMQALTDSIDSILKAGSEGQKSQQLGFKDVERSCPLLCKVLGIDASVVGTFINKLGKGKFDKTVGSLLMNADLAASMPAEMGSVFLEQIYALADQISMPRDIADLRLGYLAGAVFESTMETALEEGRRRNLDRCEAMFKKAYNVYRHPLLVTLEGKGKGDGKGLKSIGISMVTGRLGSNLVVELIRLIENTKQSMAEGGGGGDSAGWGGPASKQDPEFVAFLSNLQAELLKEFSNIRR